MISERLQIAQRFRSEGKSTRIHGNKDRDINEIEAEKLKVSRVVGGSAFRFQVDADLV